MSARRPKRRIERTISIAVLGGAVLVAMAVGAVEAARRLKEWELGFGPKAFRFERRADVPEEATDQFLLHLFPRIPRSAKRILMCYGGRDTYVLCAMTLSKGDLRTFAEGAAGLPLAEFGPPRRHAHIYRHSDMILRKVREKETSALWDIHEVRDGLLYEVGLTSVLVDRRRSRVYFYQWST